MSKLLELVGKVERAAAKVEAVADDVAELKAESKRVEARLVRMERLTYAAMGGWVMFKLMLEGLPAAARAAIAPWVP